MNVAFQRVITTTLNKVLLISRYLLHITCTLTECGQVGLVSSAQLLDASFEEFVLHSRETYLLRRELS